MTKILLIVALVGISFGGCSLKSYDSHKDFKPADPKDNIFYGESDDGKNEALRNKYGNEWRKHQ